MGLETLSSGDGFSLYPPPEHIIKSTFEDHFKLRIQRWEKYFHLKNISTVNDVLFFRPYYGKVLKELKGLFRCNISSKDVIHNCEKYIKNNFSFVRTLEGDIFGKINLMDVANESFDFIVCFHTLTHSVQLHEDLQILKGLLKKDGFVIFCDEIMKKPNNPFHMVHFDEAIFKKSYSSNLVLLNELMIVAVETGSFVKILLRKITQTLLLSKCHLKNYI